MSANTPPRAKSHRMTGLLYCAVLPTNSHVLQTSRVGLRNFLDGFLIQGYHGIIAKTLLAEIQG